MKKHLCIYCAPTKIKQMREHINKPGAGFSELFLAEAILELDVRLSSIEKKQKKVVKKNER